MRLTSNINIIFIITVVHSALLVQSSIAEGFEATAFDNSGSYTYINNLTLSWWDPQWGNAQCIKSSTSDESKFYDWGWHNYKSMLIEKGITQIEILLENINKVEFNMENGIPYVTITTDSGETLKGENLRTKNWYFRGETAYGGLCLPSNDTKKIIKGKADIASTSEGGLGKIEPYLLTAHNTVNITSNLIGAWIWIDGKNTTQRIPSYIDIKKPGEHNVTLVRKDTAITQKVPFNESLSKIEFNLKNGKTDLSLTYDA